jgi:predicted protein tyrosine phosphatase
MRGSVMERALAGDVPYPASIHHVCGLPGLYQAPLANATRIVSILDPNEPQPVELVGHEAKTLTLRFDDVVRLGGGFVLPEREHVAALLDFDRGAGEGDALVVHCHAGLSRSTAAFIALLAQKRPGAAAAALPSCAAFARDPGRTLVSSDWRTRFLGPVGCSRASYATIGRSWPSCTPTC